MSFPRLRGRKSEIEVYSEQSPLGAVNGRKIVSCVYTPPNGREMRPIVSEALHRLSDAAEIGTGGTTCRRLPASSAKRRAACNRRRGGG
jgi:hypothetical protein